VTQQDPVVYAFVPDSWQLTLQQPLQGYRFSVDAFLLADFVPLDATSPLADFGTGCGVVALCLARRLLQGRIVGVELQASLATVARQNVRHNRLEQRVDVVRADLRQAQTLFATGTFGTVVCNPPYRPVGHGRLNPNPEKAVARHELTLTLVQLLQAAQHVLRRRGVLVMIYHPARLAELCTRLQAMRLCPRRLRWVHPTLQEPAVLVLVEAVLDGREPLTVLPPLPICDASGAYSAEMQTIFRRRQAAGEIRYGSAR
jgi:tRNA1Val (adenine37-N6)-methyltransferase